MCFPPASFNSSSSKEACTKVPACSSGRLFYPFPAPFSALFRWGGGKYRRAGKKAPDASEACRKQSAGAFLVRQKKAALSYRAGMCFPGPFMQGREEDGCGACGRGGRRHEKSPEKPVLRAFSYLGKSVSSGPRPSHAPCREEAATPSCAVRAAGADP